jgi:hypothetical protein
MNKIEFEVDGRVTRCHDAAYVAAGDTAREALVHEAIQTISTSVEITAGGVKMHLAAWMDPDHWMEDWDAVGVDDVDELLEGLTQRV